MEGECLVIPTLRAGLLATTMAAAALVPAASLLTVASVDMAHAKGGNGNGNGGGNGGSNGNGNGQGRQDSDARGGHKAGHGGGRSEWAGSRGNGAGRSEAARGRSDPVSNFIRGLTGQDKRDARARAEARAARIAPTEHAPQRSIAPGKRPARNSDMHPRELGNMNGALNANINAVLAHIRNGNTNGPVGGFAALAVADAAFASVDGDRVLKEEALADLLDKAGYDSVREYQEALVSDKDPAEEIPELDAAIEALGDDVNVEDSWTTWRPDPDSVIAAQEAFDDRVAAEAGLLSTWNKNLDADPDLVTDAEQQLLDDLRDRLGGHEAEIEQAMIDAEARTGSEFPEDEEGAACEGVDGCEEPAPELASAD
jgi:hypothetical protein